ncbi:MAG: glycine cleavage system aminomethyltransferase GcvT [Proteobacteria bacterium]|nr:glycine cleavage system aminomethyltransferase GcvT [Pseudomonadota bacterium]
MVDFGGWDMPINYGSQIQEHHAVRQDRGMFDVSHMTIVDLTGLESEEFLLKILANDVRKLSDGKALYSTMLNEKGGIIDDLIVYKRSQNNYRIVVNAGTREKDLTWLNKQIKAFNATITERPKVAMLAVQGPNAIATCLTVLPKNIAAKLSTLKKFCAIDDEDYFIGRTGYTGEDGVEILLPEKKVIALWNDLLQAGVKPCGLGARDTLRLEAGMHLYGQDMNEEITPLECGLGWTVRKEDTNFIGSEALVALKAKGITKKMVGIVLTQRGILRHNQELVDDNGLTGIITSGTFSPSAEVAIGMAIVDKNLSGNVKVKIRKKELAVKCVKLPFVRNGKILIEK